MMEVILKCNDRVMLYVVPSKVISDNPGFASLIQDTDCCFFLSTGFLSFHLLSSLYSLLIKLEPSSSQLVLRP